ncbi:MAG: hypothetical protein JRI25_09390 [Deltaproteobacteria bacterium]|nr:hypothetical protein [Deltaproteobacteria bacterium]MBW2254795.1 hypothetical protein [Deltaproteobacteria bacterium]
MRAAEACLLALAAGSVAACGEPATGFAWDVTLSTFEDRCSDTGDPYLETLTYVLNFDGAAVDVAIDVPGEGPITFATGGIAGCGIDYASVVWEELRDGHSVRWQIEGSARWRQGGIGCNLEPGVDWLGTETFEILYSLHPDIPAGCRVLLNAEGVYVGEL